MPLTMPRELFLHALADAMSAEQQILQWLPELQQEALNDELREALQIHEIETRRQIENIQMVFQQLGETPEATTCYGIKGIAEEHKAIHELDPAPDILQLANLDGAAKTEHYEIAMYTGLVQMAKDLGESETADLLQENLDQEKEMAVRVEMLARELGHRPATMMAGGRR
jgi:ferritin-like metal-binding protein YciE